MKAPVGLLSDRTVLRSKMEGLCPDKFAFAKRSAAMKSPAGTLSDRTVLRSKMEGLCPDKFAFAKRSAAMKSPAGTLSDRTVLRSKMEGLCPDKFQFVALIIFLSCINGIPERLWTLRYPVYIYNSSLFIYGCAPGGDGGRSNNRRRYRTNRPRCA